MLNRFFSETFKEKKNSSNFFNRYEYLHQIFFVSSNFSNFPFKEKKLELGAKTLSLEQLISWEEKFSMLFQT